MKQGQPPQAVQAGIEFPVLLGDDSSEMSLKDMKAKVMEAGDKFGTPVRLVVIDYLELIGGNGMLGKSEAVDRVSQKIRALAKDCDCSVVVLHQVSMGDKSDGHKPLDLGSGKFGGHQPMDYVIGAYAPRLDRDLTKEGRKAVEAELWLQLLKNRSGSARQTGVRHHLDPISGRLSEWGQQHTAWSPAPSQPSLLVPQVAQPPMERWDLAMPPTEAQVQAVVGTPWLLPADSSKLDTNAPVRGASDAEWQREAARDIGPDF